MYIYIYPPPCLWHGLGMWLCLVVLSYRKTPAEYLEKWQSHCSEKVSETDFSKEVPKSRI